jgi:hypothetical protein
MQIPRWLTLGVAVLVIAFGSYRVYLAFFRSKEQQDQARRRGGMYGMPRRTQGLIGIVYLILGGALIATSFGWNPIGGLFGPETKPAETAPAPTTK